MSAASNTLAHPFQSRFAVLVEAAIFDGAVTGWLLNDPRFNESRADTGDSGQHRAASEGLLQVSRRIHAVLQRQHNGVGSDHRLQQSRGIAYAIGLDGKQHEIGLRHAARIRAGLHVRKDEVAVYAPDLEALFLQGFQIRAPGHKGHVAPGPCQ